MRKVEISPITGFDKSKIKRKLRIEIEKVAEEYEADIAVITAQLDIYDFLTSINYYFNLYKYKD